MVRKSLLGNQNSQAILLLINDEEGMLASS